LDGLLELEHCLSAAPVSPRALEAATQSYSAALESLQLWCAELVDVTAAQRYSRAARSADVLARTQVLTSLAALAFRTADSIQPNKARALRECKRQAPIGDVRVGTRSAVVTSCGRAPAVDILGSFFPAWLLCLLAAILLTAISRLVLLRFHMNFDLPVVAYPSLTACLAFALWLIFFH